MTHQPDRMNEELIEVPRGLTNVAVVTTEISDVHGIEGYYQYRQYNAVELAHTASLESVWHLFLSGRLPSDAELAAFRRRLAEAAPESDVEGLAAQLACDSSVDPIHALKAAWPIVAARRGMRPVYDLDPEARRRDALALTAMVPAFIPAVWRATGQHEAVVADPSAGIVETYLQQLTGKAPSAAEVRALTAYLIAVIDHGLNASTFTARVIASTGADVASALSGALGSLSGPLHGGAPSRVLDSLDRIGSPEEIEPWIRAELAAGRKLMGFGHAVYRTTDPRSRLLKSIASDLGGDRIALALEFERTAERLLAESKPGRALFANVEFYASVVMERVGIPRELFTATFALARSIGWAAHVLEQAQDPKIFRPSARYAGPELGGIPGEVSETI